MRAAEKMAFLLLIGFIFSGCGTLATYQQSLPQDDTPFRSHPVLGMTVYNKSGEEMREADWDLRFYIIEGAYNTLKQCLNLKDPAAEDYLRNTAIVILPPQKIVLWGKEAIAFADPDRLFIRKDRFGLATLRHEWLHIYLYFTGRRLFGDIWHRDELFEKCGYLRGEN